MICKQIFTKKKVIKHSLYISKTQINGFVDQKRKKNVIQTY